jgi:drug/metabolite transporter (DMT)-like permease
MKTKINPFLILIPAIFDVLASIFYFIALSECDLSVFQMMRGLLPVVNAIISYLVLQRK